MTLSRQHRVLKYAPLEGSALLLLLIIALHANDQGVCWPSTKLLAIETRLTRRRVQQLLRELQEAGYIRLVIGDARGKLSQIYISDFVAEEAALAVSEEGGQKPKRGRKRSVRMAKTIAQSAPDFATSTLDGETQRPVNAKPSAQFGARATSEVAKSSAHQTEHVAKSGIPVNAKVAKSGASENSNIAKSSAQIAKHRVLAIAKSGDQDGEILSHARVERQYKQSNVVKENNKDMEKAERPATKSQAEGEISSQPSLYFELLSWITGWRGEHLTDKRRGQIEEAELVLQNAGYTEQDLRDYWSTVWVKDWRYQKKRLRPDISEIRARIGLLRMTGDEIPDFFDGVDTTGGYQSLAESNGRVETRPVENSDTLSSPRLSRAERAAATEHAHSLLLETPPEDRTSSEASLTDAGDPQDGFSVTEQKRFIASEEQVAHMHELLAKTKASMEWNRQHRQEERKRGH